MTAKKKRTGPASPLDGIVFEKNSPVSSRSQLLVFVNKKKDTIEGYAQRYDVDVNFPDVPIKKGFIIYYDVNGDPIRDIVSFSTK